MSSKRNAEKMFLNECVSEEQYHTYRHFQHRSLFELVDQFDPATSKISFNNSLSRDNVVNSVNIYSGTNTARQSLSNPKSLNKRFSFSMQKANPVGQFGRTSVTSKKSGKSGKNKGKLFKAGSYSDSSRRITFCESAMSIRSLRNSSKKSFWSKVKKPFLFSVKKQDYRVLANGQFLRMNNLLFEVEYIRNNGPGRIGNFVDSIGWQGLGFWSYKGNSAGIRCRDIVDLLHVYILSF